ncbi:MAG: coniferyl-alcohol dehydrogenase [Pseudomonadota bacterium]
MANRVLITGSSSGIGQATVQLMAAAGDEIVSLDIKDAPSGVAQHVHCDLADPSSIDSALAAVDGNFDAVLNIAGVPGNLPAELVMKVNILGLRHFSEAVAERINDGGAVVNIASIAGFSWQRHLKELTELLATPSFAEGLAWCQAKEMDGSVAYHWSKEAVVVYTMQLAGKLKDRRIRCNSISPGPVETPILPDFIEQAGPGQIEWVIEEIGRAAQPVDIANVVQYLATGPSEYINGRDHIVDGGFSAGIALGWIDKNSSPLMKARKS